MNPFLDKKNLVKKRRKPATEGTDEDHGHSETCCHDHGHDRRRKHDHGHDEHDEHQHGPGCGHEHEHERGDADRGPAHAHEHGRKGENRSPPVPAPAPAPAPALAGGMPPPQLFGMLDKCPVFTLTKYGKMGAGPDGKARFFCAFEDAHQQLSQLRARGGNDDLALSVIGMGRALAAAAQGKGLLHGRQTDASLAKSLPHQEGEVPWVPDSGLPLFYSPIMMLATKQGQKIRPLFLDGNDATAALADAMSQMERDGAEVPTGEEAHLASLKVVPMQHMVQMLLEGKANNVLFQPSSRALRAIEGMQKAEAEAQNKKAAKEVVSPSKHGKKKERSPASPAKELKEVD